MFSFLGTQLARKVDFQEVLLESAPFETCFIVFVVTTKRSGISPSGEAVFKAHTVFCFRLCENKASDNRMALSVHYLKCYMLHEDIVSNHVMTVGNDKLDNLWRIVGYNFSTIHL